MAGVRLIDFLKLIDYTPEEIAYLIDLAQEYKAQSEQSYARLFMKNVYCTRSKDVV